jgi:hypothetical protein
MPMRHAENHVEGEKAHDVRMRRERRRAALSPTSTCEVGRDMAVGRANDREICL